MQSKIERLYAEMRAIEAAMQNDPRGTGVKRSNAELDLLELRASRLKLPAAYDSALYTLRWHIALLRDRFKFVGPLSLAGADANREAAMTSARQAGPSLMRREIAEAGDAAARFLAANAAKLSELGARLRALDPPVLATIARGSSDHCALYLKYLVEVAIGVPCASIGPSIASLYRAPLKLERALGRFDLAVGTQPRHRRHARARRAGPAPSLWRSSTRSTRRSRARPRSCCRCAPGRKNPSPRPSR